MSVTRHTLQRDLVLQSLEALGPCHPTAGEVYSAVHAAHPMISQATVYRNLNALCEEGRLLAVLVPEAATRFDITRTPHYHIRCEGCGRVFDVDLPYVERLEDQISRRHGFRIRRHDIIFTGECPECLNGTKTRRNEDHE